jgi:hypothetical protein
MMMEFRCHWPGLMLLCPAQERCPLLLAAEMLARLIGAILELAKEERESQQRFREFALFDDIDMEMQQTWTQKSYRYHWKVSSLLSTSSLLA